MAKPKWTYIAGHYRCFKCDFSCGIVADMILHHASEHIKPKIKKKSHKKEIPNLLPIKGVYDGRFIP